MSRTSVQEDQLVQRLMALRNRMRQLMLAHHLDELVGEYARYRGDA
jgi:hypothetical protein